ncbi:hypothetical protein V6Z11_D10G077000 [Gossypium hirsutum]
MQRWPCTTYKGGHAPGIAASSGAMLEIGRGCAHASPTATNYDIGSPSWGDLKAAPLPSAMVVTTLGHESS